MDCTSRANRRSEVLKNLGTTDRAPGTRGARDAPRGAGETRESWPLLTDVMRLAVEEAHTTTIRLSARERRIAAAALELLAAILEIRGLDVDRHLLLRARLLAGLDGRPALREVTRAQELAADAIAAKWGRSAVRRLGDGAVEITGLLDDVEMETVCIEIDGRERWRR